MTTAKSDVTTLSATLMIDKTEFDSHIINYPQCPQCSSKLVPARLAVDYGITGKPEAVLHKQDVRVIEEFTIWMCERGCSTNNLLRKNIGDPISVMYTNKQKGDMK